MGYTAINHHTREGDKTVSWYRGPFVPFDIASTITVPVPDPESENKKKRVILSGDIPSPINPPPGCCFHTRCPLAEERCRREVPLLKPISPSHQVACHLRG